MGYTTLTRRFAADQEQLKAAQLNDALDNLNGDASNTHLSLLNGTNARAAAAEAADWPHVEYWGVKADGITDDTAAINRALASGSHIRFPDTPMRVTDALLWRTPGQRTRFMHRAKGGFVVSGDFNMAARGVVDIEVPGTGVGLGNQDGPILDDLRIAFTQPDTTFRGSLINYPPGVYATNTPRIQITRPRIVRGMRGIVFGPYCGGQTVTDAELFNFVSNIETDGSADSMRYIRPHVWPFESLGNLISIFAETACTGLLFGRADDFHVTDGLFICGNPAVVRPGLLTGVLAGVGFGEFVNCDFDTFGGLSVSGGIVQSVGNRYTMGPFTTPGGTRLPQWAVNRTGSAVVTMTGDLLLTASAPTGGACVIDDGNAGSLTMSGVTATLGVADTPALYIGGAGSLVNVNGLTINRSPGFNASSAMVGIAHGRGLFTGLSCSAPDGVTGGGKAVSMGSALPYVFCGFDTGGRAYDIPGSPTQFIGVQ